MARPKKVIKKIQGDERVFYRKQLQIILNSMYDLQKLRISLDNRLKICKDGSNQKQPMENAMYADDASAETLMLIENKVKEVEEMTKKEIKNMVSRFSEWNDFLKGVKGCGEVMAAVLISQIDIEKITNASKLIAYAGINPGMKKGKKKDEDGNVYETDTLVKGDRPTKGFLIPYNKFLKTKLMGVLADSFIKNIMVFIGYLLQWDFIHADKVAYVRYGSRTFERIHQPRTIEIISYKRYCLSYYTIKKFHVGVGGSAKQCVPCPSQCFILLRICQLVHMALNKGSGYIVL